MNEIFKLLLVGVAGAFVYKTYKDKEEQKKSNPDELEALDLQRRIDDLSSRSNNIHPSLNQPAMMPPVYGGVYGYGYNRGLF